MFALMWAGAAFAGDCARVPVAEQHLDLSGATGLVVKGVEGAVVQQLLYPRQPGRPPQPTSARKISNRHGICAQPGRGGEAPNAPGGRSLIRSWTARRVPRRKAAAAHRTAVPDQAPAASASR